MSIHFIRVFSLAIIFLRGALQPLTVAAQKEFDVIKGKWVRYSDPSHLLYHHFASQAYQMLDRQEARAASLKSRSQWQQRQKEIKAAIWRQIGSFPDKTPLNARVTSVVQKDDFTVENVIYESLPGYYVTASLFIPRKRQQAAPAILFCSGHSAAAYRRDIYQMPLQNLVKKGFIVLAIDPVSQGERLQYLNPTTGESEIGSSTKEHSYPTVQAFLIGQSTARYFVWDGIRGIDYLISRKEVDPTRIGVHGLSGGGTQAAYIGALDDRVAAVAPSGYITGFKRLIESIGVQDGEQNFYHGIKEGIDHADFIEVRAPKPTLIMATTRDYFNISGTRDVFNRARKVYELMGAPRNLAMVEGDYEHGYERNIREGLYAFFMKHFKVEGSSEEQPISLLAEEELQKTRTGQIATSFEKYESVYSLNKKQAEPLFRQLDNSRKTGDSHLKKAINAAKTLSGFSAPVRVDVPVFTGRMPREGYSIERYFIRGEGDYPIPYLLFVPDVRAEKTIVYLHPEGKAKEAEGEIKKLVEAGFRVVAPDLLGVGELVSDKFSGDASIGGVSYNIWFMSGLVGRSIVGVHASDLTRLISTVVEHHKGGEIWGVAYGSMGPSIVHAAAFDNRLAKVAVSGMYPSYQAVVENERYLPDYVYSMVPGALTSYDLPDLFASLAPRPLLISGGVGPNGENFSNERGEEYIKSVYSKKGGSAALQTGGQLILDWVMNQVR